MTISEKKIELVQGLLLLQDKAVLFEIEKLISTGFRKQKTIDSSDSEETFEFWAAQFEAPPQSDSIAETESEFDLTPPEFRQRIWAAEQSRDKSLEVFFQRAAQN